MAIKVPPGLNKAGAVMWREIVKKYDLRADELAILSSACRAADMIAAIEAAWEADGRPMYTKGSMGQLVEHPAPKGIRAWQAAQDAALTRLKLPDDGVGGAANQQRSAAQSRWARHGAGA